MKKYQKLLIGAIFASILIGAAFICFKVIDNNNRNNNITNQSNRQKNISNNNKHIIYNNKHYNNKFNTNQDKLNNKTNKSNSNEYNIVDHFNSLINFLSNQESLIDFQKLSNGVNNILAKNYNDYWSQFQKTEFETRHDFIQSFFISHSESKYNQNAYYLDIFKENNENLSTLIAHFENFNQDNKNKICEYIKYITHIYQNIPYNFHTSGSDKISLANYFIKNKIQSDHNYLRITRIIDSIGINCKILNESINYIMYYDLNQSDHINNFLQATDRLIKDINNFINCFKASLGNDHEPAKIWERQLGYSKKEFEKLKNKFNNLDSSTNYDESVSTENFDINDSSHLLQFEFTKI